MARGREVLKNCQTWGSGSASPGSPGEELMSRGSCAVEVDLSAIARARSSRTGFAFSPAIGARDPRPFLPGRDGESRNAQTVAQRTAGGARFALLRLRAVAGRNSIEYRRGKIEWEKERPAQKGNAPPIQGDRERRPMNEPPLTRMKRQKPS
jgi:hypothetical protein